MIQTLTQPEVLFVGVAVAGIAAGPKIAGVVDTVRGQPRDGNRYGENRETRVKRLYTYIGAATLVGAFLFIWLSL